MISVSDEQFQALINQALEELPGEHAASIKNVAILFQDIPTSEQRHELELRHDQTLLGLYQGIPLTKRQGMTPTLPDVITLFKLPLCYKANSSRQLKQEIKHTLWHEIAHYYGLNHADIQRLE